jgi:coproporphyrinogen III oxidase-like Fe-S oxidoreductase
METRGKTAADLQSQGLLALDSERCALTRRGMLYLNTVTAALI